MDFGGPNIECKVESVFFLFKVTCMEKKQELPKVILLVDPEV